MGAEESVPCTVTSVENGLNDSADVVVVVVVVVVDFDDVVLDELVEVGEAEIIEECF